MLLTQHSISELWFLERIECNYSSRATPELPSLKQIRVCDLSPPLMKALAAQILDPD